MAQSANNQSSTLSTEIYVRDDKGKKPASKAKVYLLDAEVEIIFQNAGLEATSLEVGPHELAQRVELAHSSSTG